MAYSDPIMAELFPDEADAYSSLTGEEGEANKLRFWLCEARRNNVSVWTAMARAGWDWRQEAPPFVKKMIADELAL